METTETIFDWIGGLEFWKLSEFQKSNDLIGENLPHEAEGKQEWTQGEIEMKNSFFDNRCFPPRDIFGNDDRSGTISDHIILW